MNIFISFSNIPVPLGDFIILFASDHAKETKLLSSFSSRRRQQRRSGTSLERCNATMGSSNGCHWNSLLWSRNFFLGSMYHLEKHGFVDFRIVMFTQQNTTSIAKKTAILRWHIPRISLGTFRWGIAAFFYCKPLQYTIIARSVTFSSLLSKWVTMVSET